MKTKRDRKKGVTLIELVIGMTIMSMVMLALANAFLFLNKHSVDTQERAFAAQKAIQMMEELRGIISTRNDISIGILDDYDDGAVMNPVLTTKKDITDPSDVLSSNDRRKYMRRVSVMMIPNESLARQVFVRVYRTKTGEALAETASVIRTIRAQYESSQVYDVYVISVENIPGWWISLSSMKPMFDNVIQDLQTRNPGLEWRTHWITRLSYGRDPQYTPFINEATKTNEVSPPWVYFYPGLMDKPNVGNFNYYVPSFINGRINVDGTVQNHESYSIADQFNNAVRYPDEIRMYNEAVATAQSAGTAEPEISLRMLLERMNSTSGGLENLLLVNLHGELIPFPPIRNYSDPAKDPAGNPDVRVVTHSEQLQYASNAEVKLRVYGYVNNPDDWDPATELSTMTILLTDVRLNYGNVSIRKLVGNNGVPYAWEDAVLNVDYTFSNPLSSQTLITLYKTPLRAAPNGSQGLDPSNRFYDLEYIPCLAANVANFTEGNRDLEMNTPALPKNTARWVIKIQAGALDDGMYTIETRMDDDVTTGSAANEPSNVSRTYVWVGQTPPITEQYQFIGDPRHMPYADVKATEGFNWYFRDFDGSEFPGFPTKVNRWHGGPNVDVPRFFLLYRNGLIKSAGFWTSMTGYSNYYIGLGGEMGYDDSNGFSSGLPIIRKPWNPNDNSVGRVDEITDAQTENYTRVISNTANTWWGLYWIGELYPDSAYSTWQTNGNLAVGPGNFYRAKYSAKGFGYDPHKRTDIYGCSSFFNGNNSGSNAQYFNHEFWDSNVGIITNNGLTLAQDFNFPLLGSMTARRPFRLNAKNNKPEEWNTTFYNSRRTTLSTLENYYEAQGNTSSHDSSALIRMQLGSEVGSVVMNGLSPQTQFGSAQISKMCVINLIRGFMAAGNPAITVDRIPQVPMVTISSPTTSDEFNDPSDIEVSWVTSWNRWDLKPYTETYPSGYSESTNLITNIKYSDDNGKNWYFADDQSPAEVGVKSAAHNSFDPMTWAVDSLPRGNYILRVEVYRELYNLHYSYHQRQIYIKR